MSYILYTLLSIPIPDKPSVEVAVNKTTVTRF